jgi:hypothetical protein
MIDLEFDARRLIFGLLLILVGTEILFVIGDVIFNVNALFDLSPIRRFFNIAREDSVVGWFAVTQTWMVGLTAAFLYIVVRADDGMRWRRIGWMVIAIFLLYMAMDDGALLHERVGSSVRRIIQGENAGDGSRQIGFFPSYTWQLVFLPMFAAFGIFLLWFLNKELKFVRDKLMIVVAIGLLVLAVIADFFEGIDTEHPLYLYGWLSTNWGLSLGDVRHYSKSLEEFMEMLAMSILWVVFLRHLVMIAPEIQIKFRNTPNGRIQPKTD